MNEKIPRQKFTSILLTRCTFHNLLLATYYSSNLKKKEKNEKHLDSRKRQNAYTNRCKTTNAKKKQNTFNRRTNTFCDPSTTHLKYESANRYSFHPRRKHLHWQSKIKVEIATR